MTFIGEPRLATVDKAKIINTTSQTICFQLNNGMVVMVGPSGVLLKADVNEITSAKSKPGVRIVKEKCVAQMGSSELLVELERRYPEAVIIGLPEVAKAFPGRVYCATLISGSELTSANQKRMSTTKFMMF